MSDERTLGLISAAPQLLRLCIRSQKQICKFGCYHNTFINRKFHVGLCQELRDVIAKALEE